MKRVCLAGRHVRPYMENAAHHGWEVYALDGFNDWDAGRFGTLNTPEGKAETAEGFFAGIPEVDGAPLILCSPIESCPSVLETARKTRHLWNAPAAAIAACRDFSFLRLMMNDGIALPETSFEPGETREGWIIKNRLSAGGTGIRMDDGTLRPGEYRQERVDGASIGAVFLSTATATILAGTARHINNGFLFAGGIYPADINDAARAAMERFGQKLAQAAGLKGWWGADFIVGQKTWLVEVNPRFTASLELVARAHGIDIVSAQSRAMDDECHSAPQRPEGYFGRMVFYAERDCIFREPEPWFAKGARDIPHPGGSIKKGAPVLSLYARAETAERCRKELDRQAALLGRELYGD